MKLSAVLALVGLAPKTLPVAKESLETAKATLEQAEKLFAKADLSLEQMLEGGEDSLKAHIATVSTAAEVAALNDKLTAANAEIETLKAGAITAKTQLDAQTATINSAKTLFASFGFSADLATAKAEDVKAQFEKHAKEAAALELAKAGHPKGVANIPAEALKTAPELKGRARTIAAFKAKPISATAK